MASVAGVINGCVSSSLSSLRKMKDLKKKKTTNGGDGSGMRFRVSCGYSNSSDVASDPYKVLRIHRGASEYEVKKAFRQLALKVLNMIH